MTIVKTSIIQQLGIVWKINISDGSTPHKYLEAYGRNWNEGGFSIKAVNDRTALNISDESDTVKHNERLRQERYFTLPNSIGGKYCYLHIKTGMFRFYFYPDENEYVIYIAYVGPHLHL